MPRFNHIKNSFLAGELSPKLHGRTDLTEYEQGAEELYNAIVLPQGGASRRPSDRFIKDLTLSGPAILLPFVYAQDESYVVSAHTNGSDPRVFLSDGTEGVISITDSSNFDDAEVIHTAQSADVLYCASKDFKPLTLTRTASNAFDMEYYDHEITDDQLYKLYPFRDSNTSAITLTCSLAAVGTGRTLTASSAFFDALHVGALFTLSHGADTGVVIVTGYTSPTQVTVDVYNTLGNNTATLVWAESAWSDYRGWPRTVSIFENRLVWGGNESQPDTLWFSRSYNYRNMSPNLPTDSASDDDPFNLTLSSPQVNPIQWIASKQVLVVGTLGAEYVIQGSDGAALTPTTATARRQTNHGSIYASATVAEGAVLFPQRSGRVVREFLFNYESDAYEAINLSVHADHMAGKIIGSPSVIKQTAWLESEGQLWCTDAAGGLFGLTRSRQAKVAAWHYHQMGGSLASGVPQVISVTSIPSESSRRDELWLLVKRTVNSVTSYYLEAMNAHFEHEGFASEQAFDDLALGYSDSCVFYDGGVTPNTVIPGFSHLIGETVTVLADGFLVGTKVVSGAGTISLDEAATLVVAGLAYEHRIKPLPIEAGSAIGSAQGAKKNLDRAVIRFFKTGSAKVTGVEGFYEEIDFAPADQDEDDPVPPYTGDKEINVPQGPDQLGQITISSSDPLPSTVCAIILRGATHDT